MATLDTESTKKVPLTVIYPAIKPSGYKNVVLFRMGKKTVSPAYSEGYLPYLVQFRRGNRLITFMLSDVLETSFWRKIRAAYNIFGQLVIDTEARIAAEEAERITAWLRIQALGQGICLDGPAGYR